jgi:hypothetical protein
MVQYLFVAARNHSDLYGYLRRQFAEDDHVQVLLDRRHEERRRRERSHDPERRRGDRRGGLGRDHRLSYHGFLVIHPPAEESWRPARLEAGRRGEPARPDRQQQLEETHAIEARKRVSTWITDGQRLLNFVSKLLFEHGQLTARAETAERKCERLEEEIRILRNETEHFKRERRQLAEALKTMAKQLIEAAGGTS